MIKAHNQLHQPDKALDLLDGHVFTPCEGGEHAIAEQYIFAHFRLGRTALRENDIGKALQHFIDALVIPENLGAGIWHTAMNVPALYYQGECYLLLGKNDMASDIYKNISDMVVDYFSDMYLPSLPYYKALSLSRLGRRGDAKKLLKAFLKRCLHERGQKDYGYFRPTPFFISYFESPKVVRERYYDYLIALAYIGLNEHEKAKESLKHVLKGEHYHLMAELELAMLC